MRHCPPLRQVTAAAGLLAFALTALLPAVSAQDASGGDGIDLKGAVLDAIEAGAFDEGNAGADPKPETDAEPQPAPEPDIARDETRIRLAQKQRSIQEVVLAMAAKHAQDRGFQKLVASLKPFLDHATDATDPQPVDVAVLQEIAYLIEAPEVLQNEKASVTALRAKLDEAAKPFGDRKNLDEAAENRTGPYAALDSLKGDRIAREQELAKLRENFDWSSWKAIPVLHEGRIMPLETYAQDVVTLVTGRSKWTDPETEIEYSAIELLFLWTAAQPGSVWESKPIFRCEHQSLRESLDSRRVSGAVLNPETEEDRVVVFDALDQANIKLDSIKGVLLKDGQPVAEFRSESNGLLVFAAPSGDKRSDNTATGPRWFADLEADLLNESDADAPIVGEYDEESRTITLTFSESSKVNADALQLKVDYDFLAGRLPKKGTYISLEDLYVPRDVQEEYGELFWSADFGERNRALEAASRKKKNLDPSEIGETAADRTLSSKIAEFRKHIGAFAKSQGGQELAILPSLDPRVLTQPTNVQSGMAGEKPIPAWSPFISLKESSLGFRADPSLHAILAESPAHVLAQQAFFDYPAEFLPQLAQANAFKDQLTGDLSQIVPEYNRAVDAHARGDAKAFAGATTKLKKELRDAGEKLTKLRQKMGPVGEDAADRLKLQRWVAVRDALMDVMEGEIRERNPAELPRFRSEMAEYQQTTADLKQALTTGKYDKLPGGSLDAFDSSQKEKMGFLIQQLRQRDPNVVDGHEALLLVGADVEYEPLELDQEHVAYSGYPEAGRLSWELTYNAEKPFAKAWIYFLIAFVIVLVSTGVKATRSVYTLGVLVSLGALAYSTWGFYMRIRIAGRPPVTNMYETVIWVSYVVAVLGLWFAVLPVLWPGLSWAWRMSGLPVTTKRDESGRLAGLRVDSATEDEQNNVLSGSLPIMQGIGTALTLSGFGSLLWLTAFSGGQFEITSLTPPLSGRNFTVGGLLTWFIGLSMVVLCSWYLARAAVALLYGFITVPIEGRKTDGGALWSQMATRRWFLLGALPVACFGMMLSYYVGIRNPDILNPEIGSISAVLRNNYWLTIHVLTIVSSYGAGALAWGIGNIAVLYYLFGKYRQNQTRLTPVELPAGHAPASASDAPAESDTLSSRMGRAKAGLRWSLMRGALGRDRDNTSAKALPPKEVATLAGFGYKAMQVATLLLAVGTILGALWADVSWGRYWDWDPKEVWALISFLVYLAVLHGRFAGWVGTFGTNLGAVACFTAILMSWYGVNYILPKVKGWVDGSGGTVTVGLHSYAGGDADGLGYVIGAVVLNGLIVLAAWGRYAYETAHATDPSAAAETLPANADPVPTA